MHTRQKRILENIYFAASTKEIKNTQLRYHLPFMKFYIYVNFHYIVHHMFDAFSEKN